MISRRLFPQLISAIVLLASIAQADSNKNINHVLLISVDGLHALDVANYVQTILTLLWPSCHVMA